ncbi:hypothetical protein Tdes44962_MAKER07490 [Teratosphaeria destructans]|uniref:Uncharacterized protein n=1 Tax=Teratosphaeria destructans TaxID=418781 RepID=A0A9W7SZ36_9PEZI|nr:hypothetical protein Tdes44962_MAKER07490 [Teratosphaeria destructans]
MDWKVVLQVMVNIGPVKEAACTMFRDQFTSASSKGNATKSQPPASRGQRRTWRRTEFAIDSTVLSET